MSAPLVAEALPIWRDPSIVFAEFAASDEHLFWLDAGPAADNGWSWVGTGTPESDPTRVREVVCGAEPDAHWPAGRFRGGWVGCLGYDDAAARAGAPVATDAAEPADRWLRVERFIAFDHARQVAWAVAPQGETGALSRRITSSAASLVEERAAPIVASARHTPEEYAALVERCRDAIREGDAYQLCLTTRFSTPASIDPIAAFARLRTATPSHHGGILRSGAHALVSASPERFLEVDAGIVRTRPIKGTRPRGTDPHSDAALVRELQESPKERAENVMIVDLMRNDLSRVCETGSVSVDALLEIESYPAVHQLVSGVSGRLTLGTTVGMLLDATFPAGSMTGAPKLSAMTILNALEAGPRGAFAGCFGWVGVDGALDLAMVIRSIVFHPGGADVGAGGGITWRSVAAEEVAEVGIKARAPMAAIGASLPPGW